LFAEFNDETDGVRAAIGAEGIERALDRIKQF
jgi:hypothetical protein